MSDSTTRPSSSHAQFRTTNWSDIMHAGQPPEAATDRALARLCEAYWQPLYGYARRAGNSPEEAQDLTQDFFARLLVSPLLEQADPERGRFRTYLLTSFRNFARNRHAHQHTQRRGGDHQVWSYDFDNEEKRLALQPADHWTPEKEFDRRWALSLLQSVLETLRSYYETKDKLPLFEALKPFLTGSPPHYEALAETLQMSPGAVKVAVHRMRRRYAEELRAAVAATVRTQEDVDEELSILLNALGGG